MSFLKYPIPQVQPMQFAPPPMPVASDVNPIAAAQAAAAAQAQAAMKQGGLGDGPAPAGAPGLPMGLDKGGMQTSPVAGKAPLEGDGGGMMSSVNQLFKNPNMLMQLMSFFG